MIGEINDIIGKIVWGAPMLLLLLGTGVLLSVRLRGLQIQKFAYAMKNTVGKILKKDTNREAGTISPFEAVTTALAATVGTGNIVGIAAAITLGGPGTLFWLWVSGLLGMATKYSEVLLAVKYREKNERGDWVGGPMYYIRKGLGPRWHWLATAFCIFGALAAFGIGNAVQVGTITSSFMTALTMFMPQAVNHVDAIHLILGIGIALVVGKVLMGGIQRIGAVTVKLVPAMALIYILACLAVIFSNLSQLGNVLSQIFYGAFTPQGVIGGAAGIGMKQCVSWGVKRGVFSNEAGLGSSPIAHAATSEKNPVMQGLYGIFEVFVDTIVICTITGLSVLMSGIIIPYGSQGTRGLNVQALSTVFGEKSASLILAVGLSLFALSTVLSWGLYGSRCTEALLGTKAIKPYQIIFSLVCILGATMEMDLIWAISDTLNGLMALPNLIGILGLSGVVVRMTANHFSGRKNYLG